MNHFPDHPVLICCKYIDLTIGGDVDLITKALDRRKHWFYDGSAVTHKFIQVLMACR